MNAPQVIVAVCMGISTGIALLQHGKPREGYHHFAVHAFSLVLNNALLWWGGFWG